MKCPFCGNLDDRVIDSRASREGDVIRRRRECLQCEKRFTSYERIEDIFPIVVKKDGRREPFDRLKVITGLRKACEKRPIATQKLETIVNHIEGNIINLGVQEIDTSLIGEEIMNALRELDKVAYVRFASVYRQFKDINDLMEEVKILFDKKEKA